MVRGPERVGRRVAEKNGTRPGGGAPGGILGQVLAFVPVLLLVALNPRRRPVAATLVYAASLFAVWGFSMGLTPALRPMVPGVGPTAVALLLTVIAALAGGIAADRLAGGLARD